MKLCDVTLDVVKQWGRIETDEDDTMIQQLIMPAALARIQEYTGLDEIQLETRDSVSIPYVALCVFLYDNRSLNVLNEKQNEVVQSFLDACRVNLL